MLLLCRCFSDGVAGADAVFDECRLYYSRDATGGHTTRGSHEITFKRELDPNLQKKKSKFRRSNSQTEKIVNQNRSTFLARVDAVGKTRSHTR